MARRLTVIALGGLALSAVCLSLAASVAPAGVHVIDLPFHGRLSLDDVFDERCAQSGEAPVPGTGDRAELEWDGDDSVRINLPADVQYRMGAGDKVTVQGNPEAVRHVRMHDGNIDFACDWSRDAPGRVQITLPGRAIRSFAVNGSGRVTITDFKADRLRIAIAGSGDVRASGETERLDLAIAGSGNADMSALKAKRARAVITGSGDASIAPLDDADIVIVGSGNVRLTTQPKKLSTKIAGSGRIISTPETPI